MESGRILVRVLFLACFLSFCLANELQDTGRYPDLAFQPGPLGAHCCRSDSVRSRLLV